MSVSARVVFRDCLAIAAILLCVASAAAQAQVLASYSLCSVSARETCVDAREQNRPCGSPALSEHDGFLRWAVAMHRSVASDARIAMRTVKPATVSGQMEAEAAAARTMACSH